MLFFYSCESYLALRKIHGKLVIVTIKHPTVQAANAFKVADFAHV